jgi:hypothetical protein
VPADSLETAHGHADIPDGLGSPCRGSANAVLRLIASHHDGHQGSLSGGPASRLRELDNEANSLNLEGLVVMEDPLNLRDRAVR